MPYLAQRSLVKPLEPSSAAAPAVGPKARMPAASSRSTRPATSGPSGPTTTKSMRSRRARARMPSISVAATGTQVASSAMPGLPGAQNSASHSGEAAIAQHSACSRPPDPITNTRIPFSSTADVHGAARYLCFYTRNAARRRKRCSLPLAVTAMVPRWPVVVLGMVRCARADVADGAAEWSTRAAMYRFHVAHPGGFWRGFRRPGSAAAPGTRGSQTFSRVVKAVALARERHLASAAPISPPPRGLVSWAAMTGTPVQAAAPVRANLPEYTVSELSAALERTIQPAVLCVRVRGEVSGFKRHGSGHCYLALKDAEA